MRQKKIKKTKKIHQEPEPDTDTDASNASISTPVRSTVLQSISPNTGSPSSGTTRRFLLLLLHHNSLRLVRGLRGGTRLLSLHTIQFIYPIETPTNCTLLLLRLFTLLRHQAHQLDLSCVSSISSRSFCFCLAILRNSARVGPRTSQEGRPPLETALSTAGRIGLSRPDNAQCHRLSQAEQEGISTQFRRTAERRSSRLTDSRFFGPARWF